MLVKIGAMRYASPVIAVIGVLAIASSLSRDTAGAVPQSPPTQASTSMLVAPESIRIEHEAIHSALVEATRTPGATGVAAKELAAVLHPHFVREEEIALPPLGLLALLAAGRTPEGMADALVMSDTLRKEMPPMLEEHKAIHAAVEKLLRRAQGARVTGGKSRRGAGAARAT